MCVFLLPNEEVGADLWKQVDNGAGGVTVALRGGMGGWVEGLFSQPRWTTVTIQTVAIARLPDVHDALLETTQHAFVLVEIALVYMCGIDDGFIHAVAIGQGCHDRVDVACVSYSSKEGRKEGR